MRGNFVSADHDACGVGFVAQLGSVGSRAVIDRALEALRRLGHRGGVDADGRSGDGAGLLTAIPDGLFRDWARKRGIELPKVFGLGMVFMPADAAHCDRQLIEQTARNCGLRLLTWRQVPTDPSILGPQALRTLPLIQQCLFASVEETSEETSSIEARLFALRKRVESEARTGTYFCSLSSKTIVYKGLLTPEQLSAFYLDLTDSNFVSSFAIFHQRYSTNTRPSWSLAQPFRLVAHNGEINTITANRRWQRAKQKPWREALGLPSSVQLLEEDVSDSASFDNAYEMYLQRGYSPVAAMCSMVPPAWENDQTIPVAVRLFLQGQGQEQEPWDGPAALVFTDGESVGAKLDRNGLRPLRYTLTSDGLVVLGSEAGIADLQDDCIVERQRLGPGEVLIVEPRKGAFFGPKEILSRSQWIPAVSIPPMTRVARETACSHESVEPTNVMATFGWSEDKLRLLFQPLLQTGQEAVWSMGDDAAPAFLSKLSRTVWDHCKQRFAQVTNPPIDPLRETHVMSLDVYLGNGLVLPSPVIDAGQRKILEKKLKLIQRLDFTFPAAQGVEGAKRALSRLQMKAGSVGDKEIGCVVLSDRGVNAERAALPALLAVAAVWKSMVEENAWNVPLVIETGQVIDTHHVALLIAAGASAVLPYVAFQQAAALKPGGVLIYRQAIEKGLLKVMARMGISNISSYRNSQLFEIVGLDSNLCEEFFEDAGCAPGGKGLEELLQDCLDRHRIAFANENGALRDEGLYRFRQNGERHATSPEVVRRMHRYIKSPNQQNFKSLTELAEKRDPVAIRDLLEIRLSNSVPLPEIESEASVLSRFSTQAMSLGAISPETHRTLAIAMNRLGGRSNTGEGGEDPEVYGASAEANNRVKQVASARFGVTPEYLVNADELEIKIAQGAKPGEGGQLPATKVTPYIARLRHSAPGMALISPPPHHDIYSIEDLAQLIYDLRAVNPLARIGVKLVSSTGVGIIAAGVAKAGASVITISGHDGGTGASPLSSITNTGLPWEVGLRDAHVSLLRAGLRRRVRLRVDGGLKFGRDVIIAALLGADEFGFGTTALLALGCVMARQCHLNTCPVGIATQNETFRARFTGKPEMVESYFRALAAEVREVLAAMGAHSIDEIVGAAERLSPRDAQAEHSVAGLIHPVASPEQIDCPPELDSNLQLELTRTVDELGTPATQSYQFPISGADRAIGAHLSGEILRRRRSSNIVASASYDFIGTAGQSFGAFLIPGISFRLNGEANDYVGKGMSGGSITITAGEKASLRGDVLAGNTVLYGATGGELYIAGQAGERFGVRNSGALAVVEGVGQHACEYMTAGVVVILGPVKSNVGAGMTGGLAYVLRESVAEHIYNRQSVRIASIDLREQVCLRRVLSRHLSRTGSPVAARLLQAGQSLPLVRIHPVALPCSVSDTWDAILKHPAREIGGLHMAPGSRAWPSALPQTTSTPVE